MSRSAVGLDIGSAAVRAVEVRRDRKGIGVRRAGQVDLPGGAVEGGLVRDPATVAAAIKELWAQQRFSSRRVVLGVGSGSVLVRQLELDWMPDQDLRRSLRYQVADLLPVPVEDANLGHVPLGDRVDVDAEGRPRRLARILLVASAREVVDGLVRCAQAARLRPERADLSAFASIRAAHAASRPGTGPLADGAGAPEVVVDVGAETVTVVVHHEGRPQFVRVSPGLGGSMLTRSLVDQTGCPWEDAERVKRTPGCLPPPGTQPRTRDQAVLLDATTRLLGEVRATVEYHAAGDPAGAPRRVVLGGRAAQVPGFVEHAEAALQVPVAALDAARLGAGLAVRKGDAAPAPEHAVAFGLALGAAA